jgi:type IV fimbrial biogenesis protein FimT
MMARPRSTATAQGRGGSERGYTLIELMITVSILAVLTMVALPSFQEAFLSNRLASFGNTFSASVQLARSEAIKRNARVVLCKSTDGASCTTSGDWAGGWMGFADNGAGSTHAGNGSFDATDETRVLYESSLSSDYSFIPTTTVNAMVFDGSGFLVSPSVTSDVILELRRTSPANPTQYREIRVGPTGRVKILKCRTGGSCT